MGVAAKLRLIVSIYICFKILELYTLIEYSIIIKFKCKYLQSGG